MVNKYSAESKMWEAGHKKNKLSIQISLDPDETEVYSDLRWCAYITTRMLPGLSQLSIDHPNAD